MRDMSKPSDGVVFRSGVVDPLFGEVVVLRAYSDAGRLGWMVCHECDDPNSAGIRYHSLVFFEFADLADAQSCALAWEE